MAQNKFLKYASLSIVTATLANEVVPLSQEIFLDRCPGALKIDCEARAPRPLNIPGGPIQNGQIMFGTTAISSSSAIGININDYLKRS